MRVLSSLSALALALFCLASYAGDHDTAPAVAPPPDTGLRWIVLHPPVVTEERTTQRLLARSRELPLPSELYRDINELVELRKVFNELADRGGRDPGTFTKKQMVNYVVSNPPSGATHAVAHYLDTNRFDALDNASGGLPDGRIGWTDIEARLVTLRAQYDERLAIDHALSH